MILAIATFIGGIITALFVLIAIGSRHARWHGRGK
jgi:hypothetical protein